MKNIHIIPTDKPSRLFLKENTLLLNNQYTLQEVFPKGKCQNIYITSDEEIKEGDFVYSTSQDYNIQKVSKGLEKSYNNVEHYKKIILTTDQDLIKDGVQAIDDEFLEWFVKNPSCEEVKVEKLYKNGYGNWYKNDSHFIASEIKYKIIIPKEEREQELHKEALILATDDIDGMSDEEIADYLGIEWNEVNYQYRNDAITKKIDELIDLWGKEEHKQETLEEAANKQWGNVHRTGVLGFIEGAKWQQEQDKNKYSEEEVIKLLIYCKDRFADSELYHYSHDDEVKKWFKQFKKK